MAARGKANGKYQGANGAGEKKDWLGICAIFSLVCIADQGSKMESC